MDTVLRANEIKLIWVGRVRADPKWHMDSHVHPHWEFIYFRKGCGRVRINGTILHPRQYHVAVYPPGVTHAEVSDPVDPDVVAK